MLYLEHLGPVARIERIFLKIIDTVRSCYNIGLFACYLALSFSEDASHSTLTTEELTDRCVVVGPFGPVTLYQSQGNICCYEK